MVSGEYEISPISAAIMAGSLKIVKILVAAGADLSISDKDGFAPLDYAKWKKNKKIKKYLKKQGGDYDYYG